MFFFCYLSLLFVKLLLVCGLQINLTTVVRESEQYFKLLNLLIRVRLFAC